MGQIGSDYTGGVSGVQGSGAGGGQPVDAKSIVDGYRTNGSLDTDALARAIVAESGGDPARVAELKGALADALGPFERGAVDRALDRTDGIGFGEHVVDGAAQFGKGVWGMVKGLGSLAWSATKTSYDTNLAGLAVDKFEAATGRDLPDFLPSAERGLGRLEAGKDAIVGLGRAVWDDPSILLNEYKPLAENGRYGAIIGQAAADFGDLLIGAKGAGKAGKVAGLAGRAGDVADAAKVARAADTASELARTVRAVPGGADEAADALKATRAALDEIDVSALPDDVARKVETARGELGSTTSLIRTNRTGATGPDGVNAPDVGTFSGRPFDKSKAGGPILNLDWRTATVDRSGLEEVKLHTSRFPPSDGNAVMIERLERIVKGEMKPTDTDLRFYTHERRELERYHALGVPDGKDPAGVWDNAHAATLEDFKLNERVPDGTSTLYTKEAVAADEAQLRREYGL